MSCFTCQVSLMSLMPIATGPANSPTMHNWLVSKNPKTPKFFKIKQIIESEEKKSFFYFEVCQYLQYALPPEDSNSKRLGVINNYVRE